MYLRQIELIGFKTFAERTRLEFGPGMTAIVGPNGCGKSNIVDAVRWVLGEQSAKALRGSRMEDCIFNGTDSHKPMGIAEVSITLADCEKTLGIEYDEVTITRRVLRSGEGQYFINRAPCRLKDIQRLFMDTGVGTNAYSILEQGRIDMVLSSRPEDRRFIFEEASGITRFKADKKEAIRKLEHTEANLQRLADIIREVKRQIISLQRQAGKARRYKAMRQRLRSLDIHITRRRLKEIDAQISSLETRMTALREQEDALKEDIRAGEEADSRLRAEIDDLENQLASAMESRAQANADLQHTRQVLELNEERIQELVSVSERDQRDARQAEERLAQARTNLEETGSRIAAAEEEHAALEREHSAAAEKLSRLDAEAEAIRRKIHELRSESVDLESRQASLRNQAAEIEAAQRNTVLRRERLYAERAELNSDLEKLERRRDEMLEKIGRLQEEVARRESALAAIESRRHNRDEERARIREEISHLNEERSAFRARIDLLEQEIDSRENLPAGTRRLLAEEQPSPIEPASIIGLLADQLDVDPDYRIALEAALHLHLHALIVSDDQAAAAVVRAWEKNPPGALQLLAAHTTLPRQDDVLEGDGEALLDHVRTSPQISQLVRSLLHNVRVVESTTQIPFPILPGLTYVTRSGAMLSSDGSAQLTAPVPEKNPFNQRRRLEDARRRLELIEQKIQEQTTVLETLAKDSSSIHADLAAARNDLETARRELAVQEGEARVLNDQLQRFAQRRETVEFELHAVDEEQDDTKHRERIDSELEKIASRQADIRRTVQEQTQRLQELESSREEMVAELTDRRVRVAESSQILENLKAHHAQIEAQIHDLENALEGRTRDLSGHRQRITALRRELEEARARIAPLENTVRQHEELMRQIRSRREALNHDYAAGTERLKALREQLQSMQDEKSRLDVRLAETRMQRNNTIERICADYRVTPEQIHEEPEPEWEDGRIPDPETVETTIAELRAKMESMGPVNLVAIEELEELQQRHAFLTEQQNDLISARRQLLDMINRINKTTVEMFAKTFEEVNRNFQEMFRKMFGGGSARLVLLDEEDVLESGIEIIARPPGKKLQSVSLLSGGERTMTAVALLFALYKVKPSPFCVLDELDAALDESNIGRFVNLVEDFLDRSQFIVITHNRRTIAAADTLYGVTMEERGISKIISVRFQDKAPEPAAT